MLNARRFGLSPGVARKRNVRKAKKPVLQMPVEAQGTIRSARTSEWTLVDFLFPVQGRPTWTGSVHNDDPVLLPRTA